MYFRDLFPRSPLATSVSASADERAALVREIDNVRAALDWCFSAVGDMVLGVDLYRGIGYGLGVSVAVAVASTGGGWQSLDLLTKALDTAEGLDDLDARARVQLLLFNHHTFRSENDNSWVAAQRLLRVASLIGDPAASHNASRLMGNALVMLGRPREARGFLENYLNADLSMLDQGRLPGSRMERRALAHTFLSMALWLLGLIDQARREAQASLDEPGPRTKRSCSARCCMFGM